VSRDMANTPAWALRDPEWAATLHLLDAPALQVKRVRRAVDFVRREIDFPGLAEAAQPWSHGQRILLCAAWALFSGGDRAAFATLLDGDLLAEAVVTLDAGNMWRLMEALRLRRPGVETIGGAP
jgi:hypothetical protein